MRILVITMQFPHFPAPGGETRQYYLLKEAAREHEITLLTLAPPPNIVALKELKKFIKELIFVRPDVTEMVPAKTRGLKLMPSIFNGAPEEVRKLQSVRAIPEYLNKLGSPFDIIQVEHSEIAHWVSGLFIGTPKILVLHNVNSLIYKRFFNITPLSRAKIKMLLEWFKMKRYETALSDKFNLFVTMSEDDKNLFQNRAHAVDIAVIPNGVDTEYFSLSNRKAAEDNAVVYTGYMGWRPSEDAVIYFQKEIFGRLLKKYPDLIFYIVGKDPSNCVRELARHRNVVVTGFVNDIRPYLEKAKLVVVPLRIGGGTRLKILEAMSMGKTVVSTTIGAEGLLVHHGKDIILVDSSKDFINSVDCLLENRELRESIGKQARINMVQNYDWKLIGHKMRLVYSKFE